MTYISRVQHCDPILKPTGVVIDNKEVAMAILNGLSSVYLSLITTSDALGDNKNSITLELIKGCLLQEEQQKEMSSGNSSEPVLTASSSV